MKRFWTAMAVAFFALGLQAGCNDYNNSVQYDTGATLTNISPSGMAAGPPPSTAAQCQNSTNGPTYPCFTLFVVASSFNPWSRTGTRPVVRWNGTNLPTTFIDTTNLSALVPYSYVAKPGTAQVDVYQPQNLGTGYNGLSTPKTFQIYGLPNPFPTLSSISPTSAAYCDSTSAKCADVPIAVNGTNFIPTSQNGGSQVTFTGLATYGQETAINVNSISSTEMKATIPGKLLCATDSAQINVLNPPSANCLLNCPDLGGGDTNNPPSGQPVTTQIFSITNSTAVNSCPANVPPGTTAAVKAAVSQDGRYVAYSSLQNGTSQILLKDTCLGATKECVASTQTVSVAADGAAGNGDSQSVTMTEDGRYVAFSSSASNLVENAPTGRQVYLRDTCLGATGTCKPSTQLVSTDAAGLLAGKAAVLPSISASGRYVAFIAETAGAGSITRSNGSDPAAVSTSNKATRQIFVRDTCLWATNCTPSAARVSSMSALVAGETPGISSDGRYVTYTSAQSGSWQIRLSDTCRGAGNSCAPSTRTVSVSTDGSAGNAASHTASMTPDGRYIAFSSAAANLIENAPLGRQVYLRDTCAGVTGPCRPSTMLVSTDEQGKLAGTEGILPSISNSGRYVAFLAVTASQAGNASATPNSGMRQVFMRDTCVGAGNCTPKSTRVSLQPSYALGDAATPAGPALAGLAKQVALADGKSATVFAPTVAIDDRVLLALPNENK